jgi:hypothetical protein
MTFLEEAALISGLLARGAHTAQGQNLNMKSPEIIENFKALPMASAHARVLINVAKVMSFRGRIVTSTRGLEFIEDESGNVMLNEEGKSTLNAPTREQCLPAPTP